MNAFAPAKLPCSCKHQAQDRFYGPGVRLMNPTSKKEGDAVVYRCTVCLATRTGRLQVKGPAKDQQKGKKK